MYELQQCVISLPSLQVFRIVHERDFHHGVFAAGLFQSNPTLRRFSILEQRPSGETWSRTYCRNESLEGITVPEPKSHDLLIREFRDTTWIRGVGAKREAIEQLEMNGLPTDAVDLEEAH